MDDNLQDRLQILCPMIKLQSSDGEVYEVEVQVAKLSLYIKNMLDDLGIGENEVIPIPQNAPEISGAVLKKIIQWGNHHKDDPSAAEDDDKKAKQIDDMSSWDAEFLQVGRSTLLQMIRAADYLNINGLLDVACKKVAKMIKGKTPEEVRRTFNIQNDFSPDEEVQVRRENAWCGDSCVGEYNRAHRRVVRKIPASAVQDEDNDSSNVVQGCLNTSLILRKILVHFSDPELLDLSYVNKSWNFEARSVMKKRGKIMASLLCSPCYPFNSIESFGQALRQMNVVPYSGVTMGIGSRVCSLECRNTALDSTIEAIHTRLALKNLSVGVVGYGRRNTSCSAFLLAKKLLQDFSGVLEQITFNIGENQVEFLVQDCVFGRLEILTLFTYGRTRPDVAYKRYINALVLRAPNLKELYIYGKINLMGNVLEGSSAVLVYEPMFTYPFDRISDSVMKTIRLEKLKLHYTGPEMDIHRFNRTIPLVLNAPCTLRLRELWINEIHAVPLVCCGIPLENVKKLQMNICLAPFYPQILWIVKNFDFTRIFPNLNEVCIWPKITYSGDLPPVMSTFVEQAIAVLREPKPDRAANIKKLNLTPWSLSTETVPILAEMFPSIEKLGIEARAAEDIPFGSIWKHWVDLKELQVDYSSDQIENLDSAFCGIFPEEVAELRQKDDDFLKTVNIVPVMPAITGLKDLKALTLKLETNRSGGLPCVDDDTYLFSKVTGFIAFERCLSLNVGVEFWCTSVQPATRHLEPFTSVTIKIP